METTIVQLGPGKSNVRVATFEEAFGEYSNAGGKIRAKIQARKLNNIANKTQVQVAKQAGKQAVIAAKTQTKATKIAGRGVKQAARQGNKTNKVVLKQGRKLTRKGGRLERRALGQEPKEMGMTEADMQENGLQQGAQQPIYEEPQMETTDTVEEPTFQEDAGAQDQYQEEGAGQEQYPEEGGEEEYQEEGSEEEYPEEESFEGADGISVHPVVQKTAMNIEWNKEAVLRLNVREHNIRLALQNYMPQLEKKALVEELNSIPAKRESHLKRIAELEGQFSNYSNADGGKHAKVRNRQIRIAKGIALKERKDMHQSRLNKAKQNATVKRNKAANYGGSETPVDNELNPQISRQRIVIPATSNAIGQTGNIAIDESNDYDASPDRIIELKSNADGSSTKKGIKWQQVALGTAIGIGVILLANELMKANSKTA